jgi:hypothetical protein
MMRLDEFYELWDAVLRLPVGLVECSHLGRDGARLPVSIVDYLSLQSLLPENHWSESG